MARRDAPHLGFATRMSHHGRAGAKAHGFVNPPVYRGSTVLFADVAGRKAASAQRYEQVLTYGTAGGPTHHMLEDMVSEIEGGARTVIVGSGLAACAVPLLAYLRAGDHCLMPDSVYGPTRNLAEGLMRGWGIETTFHDPLADEAAMRALMRPETRVIMAESPGSHTFEVQDVPMLARVARGGGAKLLLDNTWGLHNFQPFAHGVDVSVQALTKYAGGHSDVLLGGVTVNTAEDWQIVKGAASQLGQFASADDCWLVLRGLRTLPVRLRHQAESGLAVARWLEGRPEVLRVLHPGLPSHPQHAIFARDFAGPCSLFGVVLAPRYSEEQAEAVCDALALFGIGASWGGYESLALPTASSITRSGDPRLGGAAIRLHVGLEEPEDLIADLAQALDRLPR